MSRMVFSSVAVLAVLMAAAFVSKAVSESDKPPATTSHASPPFRGVVVLRDGGTLSGSITRVGERYVVATTASEIIVSAANISFICHSLNDAYERKRDDLSTPTVEAHLELVEWCLRHDLFAQAMGELTTARKLDARHPRVALLERRVAVAQEQRLAAANTTARPLVKPKSPAAMPENAHAAPNDASRFNLLMSDLPNGAVERFTRKVQPVLVNSCATAGCHQLGGSPSFQLDRSLLHDMANRRSTMQNLSATLALVDCDQPAQSPLLTVPRLPHGGMEKAVFGPRDDKLLRQLAAWVALVTQDANPAVAATNEVEPDLEQSLAEATEIDPAAFEEAATLRPPTPIRHGVVLRPVEPRDEFDPEIFNRQFDADPESQAR